MPMKLAFDTYYFEDKAKTVCVAFKDWKDAQPMSTSSEIVNGIAEYEPGSFYKRELPCILSLLKQIDLQEVDCIIVDSFVQLDDHGKLGLGGKLYEKLNKEIPVIGVAKSGYHSIKLNTKELLRGTSQKPLYISSIGIELTVAHDLIHSMHGDYRMPTLLQLLDQKTKERDK